MARGACKILVRANVPTDGAPARNQMAMIVSKIKQPKDDVDMKGQIGFPKK